MDVRQTVVSPLKTMCQSSVVDSHLVQQSCIQIVNMDGIFNDVVTEVVGLSVNESRPNSAAG
jgi:hypothetical protein